MKVSELQGAELDYWVARVEGYVMERAQDMQMVRGHDRILVGPQPEALRGHQFSPSTDWSQGGPIIEQRCIDVFEASSNVAEKWAAHCVDRVAYGPAPLIAAMRAVVASKFGDEVPSGADSQGGEV